MAGAILAASPNTITVNLPHSVAVGSTVLPSGQYTMTPVGMSDGNDYFIVRGENTPAVTLQAQRINVNDSQTRVVFSKDGDTWHFDRLFVNGDPSAYEFVK